MKRAAAILLLSILAFNWVGYRFVSGFLEREADLELETRLDNSEYDESQLIELRIPLNAPYLVGNSTQFERFDGELEVEGIHYKYVKRKILNGDLVLLCIPNENKTRFQNARVDFFKLVNDLNQSSSTKEKKNAASFKSFSAEYKAENNLWSIHSLSSLLQSYHDAVNAYCCSGYDSLPEQPPRA